MIKIYNKIIDHVGLISEFESLGDCIWEFIMKDKTETLLVMIIAIKKKPLYQLLNILCIGKFLLKLESQKTDLENALMILYKVDDDRYQIHLSYSLGTMK